MVQFRWYIFELFIADLLQTYNFAVKVQCSFGDIDFGFGLYY